MLNHLYALSIKVRRAHCQMGTMGKIDLHHPGGRFLIGLQWGVFLTDCFSYSFLLLCFCSGWGYGPERHSPLQEEVRHHPPLQAHMTDSPAPPAVPPPHRSLFVCSLIYFSFSSSFGISWTRRGDHVHRMASPSPPRFRGTVLSPVTRSACFPMGLAGLKG